MNRKRLVGIALSAAALCLGVSLLRPAQACGGFFSRMTRERRPSLSYEQALIVYDAAAEREHFIREIAFKEGTSTFGFVVPTPTRPEVSKVEYSPFKELRRLFPFEPPKPEEPPVQGFGSGHGRLGGSHGGVTVLEVRKVGSFMAFVLAADDERGLAKWLRDNGLVSTPEADTWLAHYVRMKFYYVAMRYDPPPSGGDVPGQATATGLFNAETVRISFATPLPYYPYFEPAGPGASPRLLELWLATDVERTPVAARTDGGKTSWLSPFEPGARHAQPGVTRERLKTALDPELHGLLPSGDLVVQGFQDQKSSRNGWGDALFAPVQRVEVDAAKAARLEPLLGILDPALVPAKGAQ